MVSARAAAVKAMLPCCSPSLQFSSRPSLHFPSPSPPNPPTISKFKLCSPCSSSPKPNTHTVSLSLSLFFSFSFSHPNTQIGEDSNSFLLLICRLMLGKESTNQVYLMMSSSISSEPRWFRCVPSSYSIYIYLFVQTDTQFMLLCFHLTNF